MQKGKVKVQCLSGFQADKVALPNMETIAKYGKEMTAESDKNTHQSIMMKRYEPATIDAIALVDLSICERNL